MSKWPTNSEFYARVRGWPSRFNLFVTSVAEAFGIPMNTDFTGSQVIPPSQKGAPNGVASLNGDGRVVQLPDAATPTPTASSIPMSTGLGIIGRDWIHYGTPGTVATVVGSAFDPRVEQPFFQAAVSPVANTMPIANSSGKLADGWLRIGGTGEPFFLSNGKCSQLPGAAGTAAAPNTIPVAGSSGKIAAGFIPPSIASLVWGYLTMPQPTLVPAGEVRVIPIEESGKVGDFYLLNSSIVFPNSQPSVRGFYRVSGVAVGFATRQDINAAYHTNFALSCRCIHVQPHDIVAVCQERFYDEYQSYSVASFSGVLRVAAGPSPFQHPSIFFDVYSGEMRSGYRPQLVAAFFTLVKIGEL